jgi:hypothetical protein
MKPPWTSVCKSLPKGGKLTGDYLAALRCAASLALCLVCAIPCMAQGPSSDKLSGKSLEAAASFAQSLAQWEFIMIGGSLLVLVGGSYYRPTQVYIRVWYLLFLPAWACFGTSIYFGIRAQEAYLAYSLLTNPTVEGASKTINEDIGSQILWMWWGLLAFSVWLLVYLSWWVFAKKVSPARGGS